MFVLSGGKLQNASKHATECAALNLNDPSTVDRLINLFLWGLQDHKFSPRTMQVPAGHVYMFNLCITYIGPTWNLTWGDVRVKSISTFPLARIVEQNWHQKLPAPKLTRSCHAPKKMIPKPFITSTQGLAKLLGCLEMWHRWVIQLRLCWNKASLAATCSGSLAIGRWKVAAPCWWMEDAYSSVGLSRKQPWVFKKNRQKPTFVA